MRAARLECCLARDMLVPPSFDNTSDATSASPRGRRSQVGSELVPADDSASYSGRRRAARPRAERTANVKSCEPERPQDLTNRESRSRRAAQRRSARLPPSAGRGTRLQRLSRVCGEAITNLPIPGDIESEQGQVSTDRRSDDRGDERKEPCGGVES